MCDDIKDKVAVVTGAARGIGLAIVEEFLKQDAKVVVAVDINEADGNQRSNELNSKYGEDKVIFIKGDVTKDLNVIYDEIINKYKTVDILINNAGVLDENNFRRTFSINTVATVEWSMKFYEHMKKDNGGKGGVILNIASIYGFLVDPYLVFYKTSKFAVMGFSQALGNPDNFKVTGVRVVVLCPGIVRTDFVYTLQENKILKHQNGAFVSFAESNVWQEATDVSTAVVDVIKTGESGCAWVVNNGEKIVKVPQITTDDFLSKKAEGRLKFEGKAESKIVNLVN